jgi:DNA-binding transcriptional LysR family regulator
MVTIETLRTFVRVVETGSLTVVARETNASQSTISRQISQLEEHFGVRLFHRTTRHLSLTDDGRGLHEHAMVVLDHVERMEADLGRHKTSPVGQVRVAAPVSLGLKLLKRLPVLMERYPGLSVELMMEDQAVDMVEERLDLAIHSGEVENLTLIRRGLGTVVCVPVAAPVYLERHGTPRHPDHLIDHDCIVHRVASNKSEWRLIGPGGPVDIAVHGTLSTNSYEAALGAALGGLGIALLPEYQALDDIEAGKLRRVLPEYASEALPAYLVYPSRRHLPPRTRVVIDFLVDEVHRLRTRRPEATPEEPSIAVNEDDLTIGNVVPLPGRYAGQPGPSLLLPRSAKRAES